VKISWDRSVLLFVLVGVVTLGVLGATSLVQSRWIRAEGASTVSEGGAEDLTQDLAPAALVDADGGREAPVPSTLGIEIEPGVWIWAIPTPVVPTCGCSGTPDPTPFTQLP
jgi:hypothetical protein